MTCNQELLVLISCYLDGEATPAEAARVEEHLAQCADCRKRVEQWQGYQQLFTWAYTRELPDALSTDELIQQVRKGEHQPMDHAVNTSAAVTPKRTPVLCRRWIWSGAVAAALLLAVLCYQFILPQSFLLVGHRLVTANHPRTMRMGLHVQLEVGPHSVLRRLDQQTVRLEQGWLFVAVHDKAGITIETSRMKVTDRGTRFTVGIGAKADYVAVEEGAVDVMAGDVQRMVSADQALVTSGGNITSVSLPSLPPSETDDGQPLRSYAPPFRPGPLMELEQREGLKRLATRFPEVQIAGDAWAGRHALGNQWEWGLYWLSIKGQQAAMRKNLVHIAHQIAGVREDDENWEIPAAIMQVIGFQRDNGLADDVYYVCLAPKDGALVWRFTGSQGQQVDLPAAFEKDTSAMVMYSSLEHIRSTGSYENRNNAIQVLQEDAFQLAMWPAAAKPTLELYLKGQQKLAACERERELLAQMQQQCRNHDANTPMLKWSTNACGNMYYLDPQRKNGLLFAGNEKCGAQIYQAFDQAKHGQTGSVILGALYSDLPLANPPVAKGVYLVRFVLPGAAQAPHLELLTPDYRPVATRSGAPCTLPSSAPPAVEIRNTICYNTNTPPEYGDIGLELGIASPVNTSTTPDTFAFRIRVKGRPDDAATRVIRKGQSDSRRSANKEWATGWFEVQKPE